jgi:hypothetical protein
MDHRVSGWDARLMKRPGDEAILTVTGECKLPATYRADLEVAERQGEDPSQLVLLLIITLPSGLPPTAVEGRGNLNISLKMPTEKIYSSVKIADINADPETEEATVWNVPVKVIDWSNTPTRKKGDRWKGATTGSQQRQ